MYWSTTSQTSVFKALVPAARRFIPLILMIGLFACEPASKDTGVYTLISKQPYSVFLTRLKSAIVDNGFQISEGACGKCSIKTIEVPEKNTEIISVYRPELSLRMLQAGAAAGGDIPLRFYVTRLENGTARLTYHQPSQALAVFNAPDLTPIADELDKVFEKISNSLD